MRWLVRGIQICLVLVFIMEILIPLAGISAMAYRGAYVGDLSPSVFTLIQTRLAVTGAVARLFGAFQYFALVVLLEVLWTFYQRAQAIIASYQESQPDY